MAWAPAVGLLLGVIASAILLLADHPLGAGPLTASGLAVGSLALLTRGLHLDGLADLADGLASGKPAPAALDIMRRSDIGPLGVVTLVLTLLLQVAALSQAESAGHGRGPTALIAAVVTGRLALTWACRRGRRPDGPAPWSPDRSAPGSGYGYRGHVGAAVAAVAISVAWHGQLGWTSRPQVAAGLAAAFAAQRTPSGGSAASPVTLVEIATTVTLVVAAMGPPA
jgi:adenosylcobinamide-GDP ribazoletransferase